MAKVTAINEGLARLGSFRAELLSSDQSGAVSLDDVLPVHRRFIRPLLASATECFVYGLKRGSVVLERCAPILRPARGKHALDLSQEVVVGYEPLWNSGAYERGSIVAAVPVADLDRTVFRYARRFFVIENPSASNTLTAIRYCRALAKKGTFGFCFNIHSSRNVQVYGPPRVLQQLYASLPKKKRLN
jgi:hypothetical protein